MKGKFIVIEGLDGSGSSTQARLVTKNILSLKRKCIETREPSDGPIGNMIRQALMRRVLFDYATFDRQMSYLYAADRHDHLYNPIDGILRRLDEGVNVVCTRYYFSSFAYNADGDNSALVKAMNAQFIQPDLLVYLDIDVNSSMERMDTRVRDVYENEDKQAKVKRNFKQIIDDYDGPKVVIDATKDATAISWEIVGSINFDDEGVING